MKMRNITAIVVSVCFHLGVVWFLLGIDIPEFKYTGDDFVSLKISQSGLDESTVEKDYVQPAFTKASRKISRDGASRTLVEKQPVESKSAMTDEQSTSSGMSPVPVTKADSAKNTRKGSMPEPEFEDTYKFKLEETSKKQTGIEIVWNDDMRRNTVQSPAIQYPDFLARNGLQADVVAELLVLTDGTVATVEIIEGSGYADVDASVSALLSEYKFEQISNTQTRGRVYIKFRLTD